MCHEPGSMVFKNTILQISYKIDNWPGHGMLRWNEWAPTLIESPAANLYTMFSISFTLEQPWWSYWWQVWPKFIGNTIRIADIVEYMYLCTQDIYCGPADFVKSFRNHLALASPKSESRVTKNSGSFTDVLTSKETDDHVNGSFTSCNLHRCMTSIPFSWKCRQS